jgi:hypothetical protein
MKQHARHFQWVSNQKKKSCKVVSICAAVVNIAPAAQIYEEEEQCVIVVTHDLLVVIGG